MANSNTYSVYMHTDPNGKRYIGITKQKPEDRWNDGFGYATNKDQRFFDAIRSIGWNNFTHEVLETNLSKQDAQQIELDLVKKYNTLDDNYGYNIKKPIKAPLDERKYILTVRTTGDIGTSLQEIADKECRSLNNLVVYVLTKYIEQYGTNQQITIWE